MMNHIHFKLCEGVANDKHSHGHFWRGRHRFPTSIFSIAMGKHYMKIEKEFDKEDQSRLETEMVEAGMPNTVMNETADEAHLAVQVQFQAKDIRRRRVRNNSILSNLLYRLVS